ncbi:MULTISPECIES: MFS transporter [Cellulosimicrobium]|uniref:MFS transporter n=1 Tax=Cellulosimicrobium TaxID=157920 RepID=UPI0011A6CAF3|nr:MULTISPECIES: MFS transporter [Cellulosimicrobium]MBE9938044.1 MFS transporter [Cellulosimicrobium cellulans]
MSTEGPLAPSRHGLVVRMWVLTGCVAVADSVFGAVFVTHMLDQGLSPAVVGLLLMLPAVTAIGVEAPSGALGDRYGHRRLAVAGLLAWAAGLVTFALADGEAAFAVAILVWAVGLALYSGTVLALVATTLSATGRGGLVAGAVRGGEVARWSAAALAALLVVVVVPVASTSVLIATSGALLLVAGVWMLVGWPESPVRSGLPILAGLRHGARVLLGRGGVGLVVLSVLTSMLLGTLILTWQPYLTDVLGIEKRWLGLALFVMSVGAAGGAALSRCTQRVAPRTVLTVLIPALGLCLAAVALGGWTGAGAYVVAEVLVGWSLATLAVWAQHHLSDGTRATGMSILGTVSGATIAATSGLAGLAWEHLGLLTTLTCVGTSVAVVAGCAGTVLAARAHRARPVPTFATTTTTLTAPDDTEQNGPAR